MGTIDVILLRNGVFIFNFSNEEFKMKALKWSPWPLGSKLMFLMPWTHKLKLKKKELTYVFVWTRLSNLKLYYYIVNGLSKMKSHMGKPLYTDNQIVNQDRLSHARICVELEIGAKRLNSILCINEFGELNAQKVVYE